MRELTRNEVLGMTTKSKPLDAEIAAAAVSAIRRALENARLHRPGNTLVVDGVSFYFFSRGSVGSAHSPDLATEARQLVELAWVLEQFVGGQAEERELRMATENALRANHGSTRDR